MRVGFAPVTARVLDLTQAFALARETGLDLIELSYDLHEAVPHLQPVETVKTLVGETGLALSVHLSYLDLNLAAVSPSARRSAIERTIEGMHYAEEVGAEVGVLHTGKIPYENSLLRDAVKENLLRSLEEIRKSTAGMGCRLTLENLAFDGDLLKTVGDLDQVCRTFDLGITLDFGHAMIQGGQAAIRDYLESFQGRIRHLHIHSNHGSNDDHLPIDEGVIDYSRFADFLKAFSGSACMEIANGGVEAVRRSALRMRQILERGPAPGYDD